jgi:hypothetical protein
MHMIIRMHFNYKVSLWNRSVSALSICKVPADLTSKLLAYLQLISYGPL